ncbi:MAG: glucan 1,4-alpha-glucosidase [Alphaproteobacteria bacterium]|nr:glucan 1,4-alpha-glucosidase [Alphaproteobacteria bacterium]
MAGARFEKTPGGVLSGGLGHARGHALGRALRGAMTAAALALAGCLGADPPEPTWASAAKTAVGASYEAYVDGRYADGGPTGPVSRVWFSIADGVLTETMYGLIHEAQIKRLRIAVTTPEGLFVEGPGAQTRTEYLHATPDGRPLSPAYRIVTSDPAGQVEIVKHVFTDPDRQSLILRVSVRSLTGAAVTPHVLLETALANTGVSDAGQARPEALTASDNGVALALVGSTPFTHAQAGIVGVSDGLIDLEDGVLDARRTRAAPGARGLMLSGALPATTGEAVFDFALGFGAEEAAATAMAEASLATGHDALLAHYNGEGDAVGWEDYLASLPDLERVAAESTDGGRLAFVSALMLKVLEDRTHAGALIASLSNPWGESTPSVRPATGYKAVWPRDFYQVAMALAALGDRETALAAYRYLPTVQVGPDTPGNAGDGGWFLQKSEVDGTPEWVAVQFDQTAMPIMLAQQLWRRGWLSDAEMETSYETMLRPAAAFLIAGGRASLDWNQEVVTPPRTQQERWEEQAGLSPSTTAAMIAGLVSAAEIAVHLGHGQEAANYLDAADRYHGMLRDRMVTTTGVWGDGRYFLRINTDDDPNNDSPVESRNGQDAVAEDVMMDAGFLELVRYGVLKADDPDILGSLPELDDETRPDLTRVRYGFRFPGEETVYPGWRRYGVDGYGERVTDGSGYGAGGRMDPAQRGRVWPLLTGERGHFELALALASGSPSPEDIDRIRTTYVTAMERFANEGLLLPEQVWDGVGVGVNVRVGEGSNSATPLAWSHAEYLKLLRSLSDRAVWDLYPGVVARYAGRSAAP